MKMEMIALVKMASEVIVEVAKLTSQQYNKGTLHGGRYKGLLREGVTQGWYAGRVRGLVHGTGLSD